jgi:hypothetical protein
MCEIIWVSAGIEIENLDMYICVEPNKIMSFIIIGQIISLEKLEKFEKLFMVK